MTALSDLRRAGQVRADRLNAVNVSTADQNVIVNEGVQELYGVLTSTYQDYNVKSVQVTLTGGSQANNTFTVGPGGSVAPDFFQPRAMRFMTSLGPTPFVTLTRLESLAEEGLYTYPLIVPYYGALPSRWNLLGNAINILPAQVGGGTYTLLYVPIMPQLVLDTDTVDSQWLSVNGWQKFVVYHLAQELMLIEESFDAADRFTQLKEREKQRILQEAKPRDVSQPQAIVDMARVRQPFGGWAGGPGMPGGGWGTDGAGGGCW